MVGLEIGPDALKESQTPHIGLEIGRVFPPEDHHGFKETENKLNKTEKEGLEISGKGFHKISGKNIESSSTIEPLINIIDENEIPEGINNEEWKKIKLLKTTTSSQSSESKENKTLETSTQFGLEIIRSNIHGSSLENLTTKSIFLDKELSETTDSVDSINKQSPTTSEFGIEIVKFTFPQIESKLSTLSQFSTTLEPSSTENKLTSTSTKRLENFASTISDKFTTNIKTAFSLPLTKLSSNPNLFSTTFEPIIKENSTSEATSYISNEFSTNIQYTPTEALPIDFLSTTNLLNISENSTNFKSTSLIQVTTISDDLTSLKNVSEKKTLQELNKEDDKKWYSTTAEASMLNSTYNPKEVSPSLSSNKEKVISTSESPSIPEINLKKSTILNEVSKESVTFSKSPELTTVETKVPLTDSISQSMRENFKSASTSDAIENWSNFSTQSPDSSTTISLIESSTLIKSTTSEKKSNQNFNSSTPASREIKRNFLTTDEAIVSTTTFKENTIDSDKKPKKFSPKVKLEEISLVEKLSTLQESLKTSTPEFFNKTTFKKIKELSVTLLQAEKTSTKSFPKLLEATTSLSDIQTTTSFIQTTLPKLPDVTKSSSESSAMSISMSIESSTLPQKLCVSSDECGLDAYCERQTGACRCVSGFNGAPPQMACEGNVFQIKILKRVI